MLNMEYQDITTRILNRNKRNYKIVEQNYYIDENNNKYMVDNKYVILKPTEREKEVANMLGKIYGGNVKLIPRINEPTKIKTPDYIIQNEKYDLKEIHGNSKNTLHNAINKQQEQAKNFVFDISNTKMETIEAIDQIQSIYKSKHTNWVDKIVLIKGNQILKIYKRT